MANPVTAVSPSDTDIIPTPAAPVVTRYLRGLQISVVGYSKPQDYYKFVFYKGTTAGGQTFWRDSFDDSQIDYDTVAGQQYFYSVEVQDTSLPPMVSGRSGNGTGTPQLIDRSDIVTDGITQQQWIRGASNYSADLTPALANVDLLSLNVTTSGGKVTLHMGGQINGHKIWEATVHSGQIALTFVVMRDGNIIEYGSLTFGVDTNDWNFYQAAHAVDIYAQDWPTAGAHTYTLRLQDGKCLDGNNSWAPCAGHTDMHLRIMLLETTR